MSPWGRNWCRRVAALLSLVALLGALSSSALALVLPIGPGNEAAIEALTAPLPSHGPLGPNLGSLDNIRVGGWSLTFELSSPGSTGAKAVVASIVVNFDKATGAPTTTLIGVGVPGADALRTAISKNLGALTVALRSADQGEPGQGPTKASRPGTAEGYIALPDYGSQTLEHAYYAIALFILYLLGLILGRRQLAFVVAQAWRNGGPAAAVVIVAGTCMAFFLPDTVIYHVGNGWEMANSIASGGESIHGSVAYLAPSFLGMFGSHGWEAVTASRVAYSLSLPLIWLWGHALFANRFAALAVLGLYATQPALLYLSGSPFVSATGWLLMIGAGWHATLAVRNADLRLLPVAAVALAIAANFRVIGPFMGPGLALLALSVWPRKPPAQFRRYALYMAIVVTALATPRLVGLVDLQLNYDLGTPNISQVGSSIFGTEHWTPVALLWLAAAGLVATLWRWLIPGEDANDAPPSPRPWLFTLAIVVAVLIPLFAGISAVSNWVNTLRYQGWALLGVILAAGALFNALARARLSPLRLTCAVGLVAGLYGASVYVPAHAYSFEHPEQLQLRAWRDTIASLPKGATLGVPYSRGDQKAHLPFVALTAERPDLTVLLVTGDRAWPQLDYWFHPMLCSMSFFDTPQADACETAVQGTEIGWLQPRNLTAIALETVPLYEAAGLFSMAETEIYWQSPPMPFARRYSLGLYEAVPSHPDYPGETPTSP